MANSNPCWRLYEAAPGHDMRQSRADVALRLTIHNATRKDAERVAKVFGVECAGGGQVAIEDVGNCYECTAVAFGEAIQTDITIFTPKAAPGRAGTNDAGAEGSE